MNVAGFSIRCLRHRGAAAMAAALALVASPVPAEAATPAELFAKVSPSVWRVHTYDKDGLPLAQGSAVVIAPETLVTNCHVLRKAARVAVARDNTSMGAVLALWDPERDVCQVKVRGLGAPAVALGDSATLVVGQQVYALGSPAGLELTLSSGLISSLRKGEAGRLDMIQTSAPISPGSSGGGLFDEDGRLIGLTTMAVVATHAQNLNFALPVDHVRELPQRHAAREAARTVAAAEPAAAGGSTSPSVLPAPTAPVSAARLPFLLEQRDKNYQLYLGHPQPKAFAISDNGLSARASGTRPKETQRPSDPKERALQICAEQAGRACMLYSVDNVVVYRQ